MQWATVAGYILPTILALGIIYFFVGFIIFKNAHAYQEIDEGEEIATKALAFLFIIAVVWTCIAVVKVFI